MKRVFFITFLMLFSTVAWSQAITGTILGTITDPSGAVLPGVSVTAVNTGTNLTREVISNESGNYSIPNLPIGNYRVEAELTGFKKEVRTSITLQVDQRARIDFTLAVGQVSESLEVQAEAPLVQTDDSSIGSVIDHTKVAELPLNGRQFEQLVQLLPGAVTPAQGSHLGGRGGFNVAGMDEHFNSFFLDGIDNVDPIIRNFSYRPSVDLIQEFKVQESGYNAEFGRNAGAVINVTTKSGTNEVHGSSWEFMRNGAFDARNFFAPTGTDKPPLIRNQFGTALGGPIVKNKTFYFASYEGLRAKIGTTRRASVPTPLMMTGNLSEMAAIARDPLTGNPFPGNVIPQNRFNAIDAAVLPYWPTANLPGIGQNRSDTNSRIDNENDISVRVDHQLTPGTRMTSRYSYSVARVLDPFRNETGGGATLGEFGQIADRLRTNVGVSFTTVKGSRFVNEFRFGYNRFNQPQIPVNAGPSQLVPLQGFVKTFLPFNVSGFDQIGSAGQFKRIVNVYNYIDNLSYSVGNHQFKYGADIRRYLFNAYTINPNSFTFDGSRTGNPFADFLLGLPARTVSVTGDPPGNPRKFEMALYAQDDWKVSQRLTLNIGLRWEFYDRIKENVNKQSSWEADCNCVRVAGQGISERLVDNDLNNFAPRFGFAYRPFGNDKTVIRGSTGIFYDNDMRHNFEVIGNPPFVINLTYLSTQVAGGLSMSNPFPAGAGGGTLNVTALPPHYVDTYAEHFNFGAQRELMSGLLLDVSFIGNHTLKARRSRNINQAINGVRPYIGSFQGLGFGSISMLEQAGSSKYNSLQTRVEKRFAQGLTFVSSYTWGHAIDDRPGQGSASSVQNNFDFRSERGDADFDVRHRWTVSSLYQIPVGENRRFGAGWNRAAQLILGGWGFNGIGSFQGGRPFTISLNQNISRSLNAAGSDRPNRVAGVGLVPDSQGPDRWINAAAFSLPAAGTFGNAGRNIGRGPILSNVDFSMSKSESIGEGRKIEFRAEFFNLPNHPNFALPNALFDAPTNFGKITQTISNERQIQFGLRLEY